ncbi:MAG: GH1 family beta-glucosidase [Clostridia bacterium]|nr:GH1 family beta-glucosidase [Clostridia bacterium]
MSQKIEFPKNFLWGAATASYQIEGACIADGKGESIWDRFSHTPGKIANGDTGDIACNHYHLYKNDVKLMKEIGLKGYRFSIAWPRIFPDGKGNPNIKGMDFYKRLVDQLLENDIVPAVTLYHWDLPQKLQDLGGWLNRDTTDYYAEYAAYIFKELGDQIPIWITHNEPWVVSHLGHAQGIHAPGLKDFKKALQAAHHLLLSHGKAVQIFRQSNLKGDIGITFNMPYVYPASDSAADKEAAARKFEYSMNWFTDPVLKGHYPERLYEWYKNKNILPELDLDDLRTISQPVDFMGLNYYSSEIAKHDPSEWPNEAAWVSMGRSVTDMGWQIVPEGLHDLLVKLNRDYNGIKIYITENGAAFNDIVTPEGRVKDDQRIDYLEKHFAEANKAIQAGVNLAGYFVWSLLDNFEWAEGYAKRFGMVYVDYETQKRTVKDSGYWFKKVAESNCLEL